MSAPVPTTFSLSEAYRAIGIRDPRAIPSMTPGLLVPTIIMGNVQTFSGEVIEARAQAGDAVNATAGNQAFMMLHSLAKGGIVVERCSTDANYRVARSELRPDGGVGTLFASESVGGLAVNSRVYRADAVPPGTIVPFPQAACHPNFETRSHWVPPGWWWIAVLDVGVGTHRISIVWREIPEGQGSV